MNKHFQYWNDDQVLSYKDVEYILNIKIKDYGMEGMDFPTCYISEGNIFPEGQLPSGKTFIVEAVMSNYITLPFLTEQNFIKELPKTHTKEFKKIVYDVFKEAYHNGLCALYTIGFKVLIQQTTAMPNIVFFVRGYFESGLIRERKNKEKRKLIKEILNELD